MGKKAGIEIVKDVFELIVDQISNNELVKDIPVVNTVANVGKLSRSIPDYLFARKLSKFLNCIEDVSPKQRERLKEAAIHGNNIDTLAEQVMNCLQRASDEKKAEFIACIFLAYADQKIDASGFRRALDVVDSIFIDDLLEFVSYCESNLVVELSEHSIASMMPSIVGSPLIQTIEHTHLSIGLYSSTDDGLTEDKPSLMTISPTGRVVVTAYLHGMRLRK